MVKTMYVLFITLLVICKLHFSFSCGSFSKHIMEILLFELVELLYFYWRAQKPIMLRWEQMRGGRTLFNSVISPADISFESV